MECVYYKCHTCNFVHQVPSYWSGFAPEKEIEMPHINMDTKEMCSDMTLILIED